MEEEQQLLSPPPTIECPRGGRTGVPSSSTRGLKPPGLRSRTGPQDEESRAIREASRQRLQEQRRREREERRGAERDRSKQSTVTEERVANAAAALSGGRGLARANLWEISTTSVRGLEWPRRDVVEGRMASVTAAPAGSRGVSDDQGPVRGDKQRGEQISRERREWQEGEVQREGAGQGLEGQWRSREGQEQGREEPSSQRWEEWEEHMRHELCRIQAEETVRETARRAEETARIAMPVSGISMWKLDIVGGDRSWRGEPTREPSADVQEVPTYEGQRPQDPVLHKVGAAEPLHKEGLLAGTTRRGVERPAAPARKDRQRRYSPGGRGGDSEETINRLRERAEQISRESQDQREGETESLEARQWLQSHRQQREEEARRREWRDYTRLRRENARGRSSSSPSRKEAHRYSLETVAELKVALSRVLAAADKAFQEKQAASDRREWCEPIPLERKVETRSHPSKFSLGRWGSIINIISILFLITAFFTVTILMAPHLLDLPLGVVDPVGPVFPLLLKPPPAGSWMES